MSGFKLSVGFEVDGMIPGLVLWELLGSMFAKNSVVLAEFGRNVVQEGSLGRIRGEVCGVHHLCASLHRFKVLDKLMLKVKVWGSMHGIRQKVRGGGAGF
jgi:hypothetical protein